MEYILLLALVAVVSIAAITFLGKSAMDKFNEYILFIGNATSGALERANTRQVDCVSLSILIGEDSDTPLEDQIAGTAMDAEETAIAGAEAESLKEAIRLLPPQHAQIIRDVYHHQMPLNEVARKMKLSPQRVQAIHARALKMLRRRLKTQR